MSSEARAMVTMPVPMFISTAFCDCASRQPDSAVNEPAMHRPTMVVKAVLIDDERTMSGLLPVARIARPRRVLRNAVSRTSITMTAISATASLYCFAKTVPLRRSFISENTVSTLFMLSSDEPPMIAMFME